MNITIGNGTAIHNLNKNGDILCGAGQHRGRGSCITKPLNQKTTKEAVTCRNCIRKTVNTVIIEPTLPEIFTVSEDGFHCLDCGYQRHHFAHKNHCH